MSISTNLQHTISSVFSHTHRHTHISFLARAYREKSNLINLFAMAKANNMNGTTNGMANTHSHMCAAPFFNEQNGRMCGILSQPTKVNKTKKKKRCKKIHLFAMTPQRCTLTFIEMFGWQFGCLHTKHVDSHAYEFEYLDFYVLWHQFQYVNMKASIGKYQHEKIHFPWFQQHMHWHSNGSSRRRRQNHFPKWHRTQF